MKVLILSINKLAAKGGAGQYISKLGKLPAEGVEYSFYNFHSKSDESPANCQKLFDARYDFIVIDVLFSTDMKAYNDPSKVPSVYQFLHDYVHKYNTKLIIHFGGQLHDSGLYWSNEILKFSTAVVSPRYTQESALIINHIESTDDPYVSKFHSVPVYVEPYLLTKTEDDIITIGTNNFNSNASIFAARMESVKRPIIAHEIMNAMVEVDPSNTMEYAGYCLSIFMHNFKAIIAKDVKYDYTISSGYDQNELDNVYANKKYSMDFQTILWKSEPIQLGVQLTQLDSILRGVLPVVGYGCSPVKDGFYEVSKSYNEFPLRRKNHDFSQDGIKLATMTKEEYLQRMIKSYNFIKEYHNPERVSNIWSKLLNSL